MLQSDDNSCVLMKIVGNFANVNFPYITVVYMQYEKLFFMQSKKAGEARERAAKSNNEYSVDIIMT